MKTSNDWYSLVEEFSVLQNLSKKICVFQLHFQFVQNLVQKLNPVHVTKIAMQEDDPCK